MARTIFIVQFLFILCISFFSPGCERRPVKIPVDTISYENPACDRCGRLLVFLPGKGDMPDSFEQNGFIEMVISKNVPFDMLVVDAHLGYYLQGNILERLEKDVIGPARRKGYREIWFAGISLGCIGALGYIDTHPEDNIEGAVLIGPYLGEDSITDEIIAAGGLRNWEPGPVKEEDWQRKIWSFLKAYISRRPVRPKLFLAYGENDRFSKGAKLVAASLPPDRVFINQGRHAWTTWKSLWEEILTQSDFNHPDRE